MITCTHLKVLNQCLQHNLQSFTQCTECMYSHTSCQSQLLNRQVWERTNGILTVYINHNQLQLMNHKHIHCFHHKEQVNISIVNQAQSEYKHVLANILCSLFVARTPPVEARIPDCRSNVENAPRRRPVAGGPAAPTSHILRAILRTPPVTRQSAASNARRPRPAGHSHYVISRDGCKLVTRVRVILPQQRNPCPDCKSAQQCTTRGQPLPCPQVTSGSVQQCGRTAADRQTDRHTHTHRQTHRRA